MRVNWPRIIAALVILASCAVVASCMAMMALVDTSNDSSATGGLDQGSVGEVSQQEGAGESGLAERDESGVAGTADGSEAQSTSRARQGEALSGTAGEARPGQADVSGLTPFRVLTLQYTPYMATLALMDARGYMERLGYDLQLYDVYAEDVDLDEDGQCEALNTGRYDALATTLDATRKCGEGVAVAIPIGQSAGNDAIVVKEGVETWNDVFEHAVAFTGYSVSEYMACFASHTANEPMRQPIRFDDASEAVDAWLNSGPEQNIQSVVAWEPEVSRALANQPGSRVILSSSDVRILWDVIEFSRASVNDAAAPFEAFTSAYYQALLDLVDDPRGAFDDIALWAEGDVANAALMSVDSADDFVADLDNEAFATLRDAAVLMDERDTLLNRLDEAEFYWTYCGVEVPPVEDLEELVMPEFVIEARQDSGLLGAPGRRPSEAVFQISDFTDASVVTDQQIEAARVLFATGVDIEFAPNRTDFRNPEAAYETLENAVRFLRTCTDCVLEVQGGAAYPGERVCPDCKPEDSDELAVARGRRVYDELRLRFDVPEAQLRFVEEPHPPQYPGSNLEQELRQDRRTFLTGYQLGGR